MKIVRWQSWYEILKDSDWYVLTVLWSNGEHTISILNADEYVKKVAELEKKYIRGIQNV